ncbi:uncharacterized protein LOC143371598 isoform X2 [Andrena cerasifolii]|uniref:uncharacterized protein LOC143371598 isoform X2 n=1 Tax=Andrena cerasifolii TaxID=2819439 RepID=UPI004037B24C
MQVLVVFLLLAGCRPSASIGVYSRENSGLQSNLRSDELFQTIRDWFGHLKDRIHDGLFGQTVTTTPSPTTLPSPMEVLNLDKFQLRRRLRNREWLQIDLSTLSFDPDRDWGFRVGNWYFIRKEFKDPNGFERNNSDESSATQTTVQQIDRTNGGTRDTFTNTKDTRVTETSTVSTTTEFTTQTVSDVMTQQTDVQTTDIVTRIDSVDSFSPQTEKLMEDNETSNGGFVRKGSVEVLMG